MMNFKITLSKPTREITMEMIKTVVMTVGSAIVQTILLSGGSAPWSRLFSMEFGIALLSSLIGFALYFFVVLPSVNSNIREAPEPPTKTDKKPAVKAPAGILKMA